MRSLSFCFVTSYAISAPAIAVAAPERPQSIYNGTDVAPCGWPSTVAVGGCTGTLVHPEVVISAGHCGASHTQVVFGEDVKNPARTVKVAECFMNYEGFGHGTDVAVCRLEEPVTDVPIVPILMGCELDFLLEGAPVTMIGFGEANTGPTGIKRETTSEISYFANNEVFIDSNDLHDSCLGDSGGPVMLQLPDGGWRVFGINAYRPGYVCGTGAFKGMMHTNIEWLESRIGVDLTPCHTVTGEWDPGPGCGGFPLDPGAPTGEWATGCQAGAPVSGPSSSCGAAYDEAADTEPPQVEIVLPEQGQEYTSEGNLALTITAVAHDGVDRSNGWGIASVRLLLNDKEIANNALQVPPYEWSLGLPSGPFLISAVAVDRAGHEAFAPPIAIGVNVPPPPLPAEETSTGESPSTGDAPTTSESSPGDVETTGPAPDGTTGGLEGDTGCGCHQSSPTPPALILLALLGLRRRRLTR